MPECSNCGSHVTDDYRRVFTPSDVDEVRVCPNCPDLVRDGPHVRDARSTRHNGTNPSRYDPQKAGGDNA